MSEASEDLIEQRLAKARRLAAAGVELYPARSERTHTTGEALTLFAAIEDGRESADHAVTACGRVRLLRWSGKKVAFIDLVDGEGKLQLYLKEDHAGAAALAMLRELDLGDFVQASGTLFRTRAGEPTLQVHALTLLCKALRPPPEKWHGVTDPELRYRQRYLDLQSDATRLRFRQRSQIVAAIRRFMDGRGFIEVETPVLQAEAGGAAARPFTTFFNALDEERVLRISLELHLKRLLVGGFDKVYEIGRIFRNEGLSPRHNPEFTMLESYEAYADYRDVALMVEQLVSSVAQEVLGTTTIAHGEAALELAPPWRRATMRALLAQHADLDLDAYRDEDRLRVWMHERRLQTPPAAGWGKLIDEVFSECVQPHLQQPTFVLDYPVELSPLAKRKVDDPTTVERFEAFIGGFEIANAYSELNDPLDQRERFERQVAARDRGDDEVELVDEDFLVALEHGMPPAGGLGIGIDRLLMVLLDQTTIREVILFPQLRTLRRQGGADPA